MVILWGLVWGLMAGLFWGILFLEFLLGSGYLVSFLFFFGVLGLEFLRLLVGYVEVGVVFFL